MTITDDITALILLGVFIFLVILWLRKRTDLTKEQRDALIFGVIASLSILALRVLAFFPAGYEGRILHALFLSAAAGSFASLGQLYLANRSLRDSQNAETSDYNVTWELKDGSSYDTLLMTYTVVFDRRNFSGEDILGLRHGALEPYPWAKASDYKFDWARCAANRQNLQSAKGQISYYDLPIKQTGWTFEVDSSNNKSDAALIKPNETKWYSWRASVEVPSTYWDTSVGRTSFKGVATYHFKDNSTKDLVVLLIPHGKEKRFDTNLNNNEKELDVAVTVDKKDVAVRCQIAWCPRSKVVDPKETLDLLQKILQS